MSEVGLSLGLQNEASIEEEASELTRELAVAANLKSLESLGLSLATQNFVVVGDEVVSNSKGNLILGVTP